MAREIIINVNVDGTENAISNIQSLEQEIEQLNKKKAELLSAPSASSGEFVDRLEEIDSKLGKLNSAYESATGKAKKFEQTQRTLEGVSKTIAGSIGIASSALATFGVKNEEVEKALLKVQAAASLATGIKDLQEGYKALSSGLNLAKTAQLGFNAAMLANPYVLAAAALAAVVVGIVAFAGSTDEAADSQEDFEESLVATNRALEKQQRGLDAVRFALQQNEQAVQNQINLLKAQGASAEEIAKKEEELARLRIKNSVDIVFQTKEQLLQLTGLQDTATDAEIKRAFDRRTREEADIKARVESAADVNKFIEDREKLRDKLFTDIAQARANTTQAQADLDILQAQRVTDANKRALDAQQKARDAKAKKDEKASADAEKAEKEREKIRKETTDNILKDLDEQSKAIIENNNKQLDVLKQRLIEGKITEETFAAEKVLLDKKSNEEIIALRDNFQLTQIQQFIVGADNEKQIRKKNAEEVIKLVRQNADIELGIVKNNNQATVTATAQSEKDRIEVFEKEWLQKKIELLGVEGLEEETLAAKIKQLELDKNKAKLETLQVGSLEYLSLKEQIAQQERAIDKKTQDDAIKNQKEIQDATIELAQATLSSLSTLSDIYFENQAKKVKGNAKEEEKLARKQFQINKALQLGTAIINGVNSILAITSVPDFTLGVQSAIRIGAQVALNAASIAKIIATKFEPNSTGASSGGGTQVPSLGVSGSIAPTTFQPSAFGTGISQQQTFGAQQGNGGNVLRAYVSESDLTSTQNRLYGIRNASEL